jgi:hypothetical protein
MYTEDLILRLAGVGKYIFEPDILDLGNSWELNFVNSVATQIESGNALTEKQAPLVIKILKKYQTSLEIYFQQKIDLDNPVFKTSFRKISNEKSIKIENIDGEKKIVVRFPYDEKLIKSFHGYISGTSWKSFMYGNPLKAHIAEWNSTYKAWIFGLREDNILWLHTNLVEQGFVTDNEFNTFLNEINQTLDNMFEFAPYVTKQDGKYCLKNVSKHININETDNLIEYLLLAKNAGITAWDEGIDQEIASMDLDPVTQANINTVEPLFVDCTLYDVEQFENLVKFGGPTLIIVPGGIEGNHTRRWHESALKWGIDNSDMTVLFRMPNESHGTFNAYIKEHQLNNEVYENTKVVFVSTKIPKPLIKSGLKFNTVINLGYYKDLHYSMSVLLQSTPNIVYYNNKHPHGVNVWPQQN